MTLLGWLLVVLGTGGVLVGTLRFVRVTLPHHYGSNPGFGAYEVQVLPPWVVLSVGTGLVTASARVGVLVFLVGLVGLGFLAQLLGRVFGR